MKAIGSKARKLAAAAEAAKLGLTPCCTSRGDKRERVEGKGTTASVLIVSTDQCGLHSDSSFRNLDIVAPLL